MKGMMMKKRFIAACAAVGLYASAAMAYANVNERVQRAEVGPVELLVYPMDVKNVVSVQGVMPLGDAAVAVRKVNPAIPSLVGMMLEAGTTQHDKYQIADIIDATGAITSINTSDTQVVFSGKSLVADMPKVVGLLLEQLRSPAFTEEEFGRAKDQFGALLQQIGDDTDARAWEGMTSRIFSVDNPSAPVPRETLQKALGSVSVAQLKAFHSQYFGPEHMTLVFTGDVDMERAKAAVASAISGWKGGVDFARNVSKGVSAKSQSVQVAMTDKASVSVMWGQATGLRATDADYLPLALGVDVLGSGFTGRLMSSVRDREGLTYGISANLFGDDVADGGFMMQASFAPELLQKGVASSRRELQRWWKDGITANELDARKQALAGSFQLSLGTTDGMAHALLMTRVNGRGLDWLDQYPSRLKALTLEQVNGAIRKHINPQTLVQVEAGTLPKP